MRSPALTARAVSYEPEEALGILIALCRTGDQAALARLYDRTGAQVQGLAERILGERGAAEEVTIEHRVAEHCYVLSGDVRAAGEVLGPGDYHLAAAGTTHADFTSERGCLLLIVDGPAA